MIRALAALFLAEVSAYADISPTQWTGSGIAPQSHSSIQMQKAEVEIVWGTPCMLSATFTMVNSSPTDQELTVGFPMPSDEDMPAKVRDPLAITFNGEAVVVTPPDTGKADQDKHQDWAWYRCHHTFKPGNTTVKVTTILRASLVYTTPFRESLFYCIQTGGNWAGKIGEEEVTIRFPAPPEKDQITGASPAGFQIEGDCVRWHFVDFKPVGKEFDIALTYVRPDVMRIVAALRKDVAENPESSAAAVKLAKHLLVLGNAKSNSGFPPSRLTKDQYDGICAKIAKRGERKLFREHYHMGKDGLYEEASSEWTPARVNLVQILADAGYRDQRSQSPLILEAEKLLKDTLARDPHNCEAWNVYLASYWRFSFAAVGHWFGTTRLSRAQASLIETAAKNCPDDECIGLWLKLRGSNPEKPDTTALFEAIKRHGVMVVEYPKFEYGYY